MSDTGYPVVPEHLCAACGASERLVRESRDVPFAYRGESTLIKGVRGVFCTACGEGFADMACPQDWLRLGEETAAFVRQVDAEQAVTLRVIRKKLGLRQAEAGKLFGGGVSAFSEYERGKTQPHKSTLLLLKLLDKHPELLKELAP